MAEREDELLQGAIRGDADALSELLKHYAPELRRGLKIGEQWQSVFSADDVMQVTYLEAFLRIKLFKPTGAGAFLAWLRRIADNNLRDAIKALSRDKRPPPGKRVATPRGDESFAAFYEHLIVTSSTPSRRAARGEAKDMLESAIGQLSRDYAKVVRMYDLDGRSAPEVAEALGRSRGAVFMLRARAHDQLREIMGSGAQFFSHGS